MSERSEHYTVRVEIHHVTSPTTKQTCRCIGQCSHSTVKLDRTDTEVVNMTARVEGGSMQTLDQAISKAIRHLECERPTTDTPATFTVEHDGTTRGVNPVSRLL